MVNNADWLDEPRLHPVPARLRPALLGQPDADLRLGEAAPRARAAADLPRIQLHDPPGLRFPGAGAAPRLPAADGRLGPVGQHRQRRRARPPRRRPRALRPDLAADHHGARAPRWARPPQGAVWLNAGPAVSPSTTGSSGATPTTPTSAASCACSPICRWTRSRAWRSSRRRDQRGQEVLANEATRLCHGEGGGRRRESGTRTFSRRCDTGGSACRTATACRRWVPRAALEGLGRRAVPAGRAGSSNGEARRLIRGGGARINDAQVEDEAMTAGLADLVDGQLLLSAGKKRHVRVRAV